MSSPPAPSPHDASSPGDPPLTMRPGRGSVASTVVAWCVIGLICVGLPLLRAERSSAKSAATRPTTGVPAEATAGDVSVPTRLGGRYAVGVARYFPQGGSASAFVEAPATTPQDRVANAIVAGEVLGREAARARLEKLDSADAAVFQPFYAPPTTRPDAATERPGVPADIAARYGWFARLAESFGRPNTDPVRVAVLGEAKRTMVTIVLGLAAIVVAGAIGFALLVTAVVLLCLGKLRFAVGRPVGRAAAYVEAFALYLAGVVVVGLAIGAVLPDAGLATEFVGLGSVVLLAAAWPFVRGVRWPALRQDWGLHAGQGVFTELACGVAGYLAGLPVLFVGVLITAALVSMTHADASHPIQQEAMNGSVALIFVIASVFAPLTEEMLFRGALVSHLRGGVGVFLAAAISGLVFAAVHPQGWAAVPALGSIGVVLALVRQWRGTLLASMAAHALNNTFVIAFLLLTTR